MIDENEVGDAFKARLQEDSALLVFDGEAVKASIPANTGYIVYWVTGGLQRRDRVTGPANTALFTITVHTVGVNRRQAGHLRGRMKAKAVDWIASLGEGTPHPLSHEVSLPARSETDSATKLWFTVDQFDLLVS